MPQLNYITPRSDIPIYDTPPLDRTAHTIQTLVNALLKIVPTAKVTRAVYSALYKRRATTITHTLRKVWNCSNRTEVERLLGPPKYQLASDAFVCNEVDGSTWKPDVVEVYRLRNAIVYFWFKGSSLVEIHWCFVPYVLNIQTEELQ